MKARPFLIVAAVTVFLIMVGVTAYVSWRDFQKPDEPPPPVTTSPAIMPGPGFTYSRETTYVVSPVSMDGYVDYPAALNERLGKGVTPETNANVLLLAALGPMPGGAKRMPARYFELLGAKEPPEKGEYFVGLKEFVRDRLKTDDRDATRPFADELRRLAGSPWAAKDHPEIAAWLAANREPLATVVEATKRPHYYSPVVGSSILGSRTGPVMLTGLELANALASRAMLVVNDGKPADAWQDLLACHRLGRLLGRGGTSIAWLRGTSINQTAGTADVAFLDRAGLSAGQIRDCAHDLQSLPPVPALVDCVDVGERFEFLNEMMMFAKHGFWYLAILAGGDGKPYRDEPVPNVNWDPGLRAANQWFDAVVAAMRESDRLTRQRRLERIETDLKEMKARPGIRQQYAQATLITGMSPYDKGRFCGEFLLGLIYPAVLKLQQAADWNEQSDRNLRVAFALAAFRADQKGYPKALAELAPEYLDKVPDDLFTDKPLVYRPDEKGFLLYSLGPDGKDDGGRTQSDDPKGDDIAIRIPVPDAR